MYRLFSPVIIQTGQQDWMRLGRGRGRFCGCWCTAERKQSSHPFTGCVGHHSLSGQTGSCTCRRGTGETWGTFCGTDPPFPLLDPQFLALWLALQLKQNRTGLKQWRLSTNHWYSVSCQIALNQHHQPSVAGLHHSNHTWENKLAYGGDRLAIWHNAPGVSEEKATSMKNARCKA